MSRWLLLFAAFVPLALATWVVATQEKEPPRKNLKGWELYYQATPAGGHVFGLLPGTNRQKTDAEVKACLTLAGMDKLAAELAKLAPGESVIPQGRLPEAVLKELKDLCAKHKLELLAV